MAKNRNNDDEQSRTIKRISKPKQQQQQQPVQTQSKSQNRQTNRLKKNREQELSSEESSIKYTHHHSHDKISIPTNIISKIHKIESMPGAIVIRNEATINTAGYFIDRTNSLNQTEYSQILRAKKKDKLQSSSDSDQPPIAVKITNLTECSPRFRGNLLRYSVRIMRYVSTMRRNSMTVIFPKIYEVFQMDSVKLYIFMDEYQVSPTLYDLVKSPTPIKPDEIREYMRAIVSGISVLQKLGVAHRYLKLQHILFDMNNKIKLCGWSKAVFYYQIETKKVHLQSVERRVRRNYFLPPEAFQKSYDPSKADIWSIGVLLVSMTTKRYPFNVRDDKTKFSNQWRDFVRKHEMNAHVRSLCNKIFVLEPKGRIDCDRILTDRYFDVPTAKLVPLSIKASTELIERESSRVGALSAIDFEPNEGQITGKTTGGGESNENQAQAKAASNFNENEENPAEVVENDAELEASDTKQQIQDGGKVGEEENLPSDEKNNETKNKNAETEEEGEGEETKED
ncbi:uncharacterized protein LOC113798160 [Dermatophagoides pteronyssinus]|uniref:Serine/threonine-protein kinase SRK2A-like n=1 Tax=Dermatophagoides pteronyssinus TaxID=6956 RepID=A0A6P6YI60_DERPT|nr:serine/threonine-protein kinase SRK2A-like [Dermatophagoides pteronyssinus]XP_027204451.1 serine/threonine-protein kinase SRK2A-like [Dermatophagoides pteronyssinus]XP_027204452.1 serine/threonine-protein kinase SRK2A-like [Dermatophagoides pteronyssinus]